MFAEPFWIVLCSILTAMYIAWRTYSILRDKYAASKRMQHEESQYSADEYDENPSYQSPASVHPLGWLSPYEDNPIREQLKGKQPLKYSTRSSPKTASTLYGTGAHNATPILIPSELSDDYFVDAKTDECIDGRMTTPPRTNGSGKRYPW